MSTKISTIPTPPKKNDKRKFKRIDKDYVLKNMFISNQKKYDLLNLEIDFLINIDKINNSIGRNMISNSFVIRNIENVNLQKIEYLLSQIKLYINLYLNSYNQILNLNEMNELFKIINNIFQKSKNI
tara:strand:- start:415 stop:795 length:381 start_codon:yes stop_codon:yes gene_type:complete